MIVRVNWNQRFNREKTWAQRHDMKWYVYRWGLWKQYTEPSLLRQTHQDFEAWLLCDPELREFTDWMPMPDSRFRLIYDRDTEARKVKPKPQMLYARIDNDDMYCDTALQELYEAPRDKPYIQFAEGWVLNHEDQRLYVWNNPSPAFLAKTGGPDMFATRLPGMINHGDVCKVAHRIMGKKFVVVVHGNNVCNRMAGRYIGPEITGSHKAKVFAEYHLGEEDGKSGSSQ
tara:strand:- start:4986 stop:5672 length:687 start_codon:yes stop_codon:yes gene_type:complete